MKNIQYVVLINMLVSFVLSFLIALVSPAVTSIVNGLYFLAILVPPTPRQPQSTSGDFG